MVSLDQALMAVGDTDNQGLLLDSPLHFIGFSRGTVVKSEIIQRLGTYYPNAGGVVRDANGQVIAGDLHMTTIDPHDFDQPSLGPVYRDFEEPEVKVWDNVTFVDNYYQTVPDRDNGFTFTPRGRKIEGIPEGASVELNGKAGFTSQSFQRCLRRLFSPIPPVALSVKRHVFPERAFKPIATENPVT